jgi:hypothetical protein
MSSSELTRICVEKVLPHEREYHSTIKGDSRLSAAFWRGKLWTQNSTVTISFLDDPSPNQPRTSMSTMRKVGRNFDPLQKTLANAPLKEAVKTVVAKRIQPLVNLKLKFVKDKDKDADIRISFADPDASWSLVGTDATHPSAKSGCNNNGNCASMNLGWFDVGTYIHEFGHAMGMIHEHQNTSHGQVPIDWNKPKLYQYMENTQGWDKEQVDTNVIGKYKSDQLNGSKFDAYSVMIYFFPAKLTKNGVGTRQNFRLSGVDAEWINKSYPGGENPATFYSKAYGQSLSSSIAESNSLRNIMTGGKKSPTGGKKSPTGGPSGKKSHHLWIYIGVLLTLLVGGLIIWFVKRRHDNK